jgi:hypothetical protein
MVVSKRVTLRIKLKERTKRTKKSLLSKTKTIVETLSHLLTTQFQTLTTTKARKRKTRIRISKKLRSRNKTAEEMVRRSQKSCLLKPLWLLMRLPFLTSTSSP